MTENTPTPAEEIAEARLELEGWEEAQGDYDARDWGKLGQLLTGLVDALEAVTAERDALAAVIEQAKAIVHEALRYADDSGNGWDAEVSASALDEILSTAPATVLAEVKAKAWDEGAEAVIQHGAHITWDGSGPINPYRDA